MSAHMSDCIFCQIASGAIPAELLYTDENCVAFRDIHPQAPTHILVVPRQHVRDLPELFASDGATDLPDRADLPGQLLRAANQIAKNEGLHESGFRVVVNSGAHAGQSVPHLHLHILGKRPMAWPPG
jgi:histidine triad (HIT) family protein